MNQTLLFFAAARLVGQDAQARSTRRSFHSVNEDIALHTVAYHVTLPETNIAPEN